MTDTEMIDWIERVGAQVWRDREAGNWTVQAILAIDPKTGATFVIQPTRATLRAAITDAYTEWMREIKQGLDALAAAGEIPPFTGVSDDDS